MSKVHMQAIAKLQTRYDELHARCDRYGAALAFAKAKCGRYGAALISVTEYWDRRENDTAMIDALYAMIDIAEKALEGGA